MTTASNEGFSSPGGKTASVGKDDMVEMMAVLDADGDGEVTKDEFKTWYLGNMRLGNGRKVQDADFERLWTRIDADGDGMLQQSELCAYFGISFDDASAALETRKCMTDEDVLDALQLQTQLHMAKEAALALEAQKKARSQTQRTAGGAREGVKLLRRGDASDEGRLLELCEMVLPSDREAVASLIERLPGAALRCESVEKAEMPLHKLARNGEAQLLQVVYDKIAKEVGREAARADLNSQDKRGWSALFSAIEGRVDVLEAIEAGLLSGTSVKEHLARRTETVRVLLALGADLNVETHKGWNALHCCAHFNVSECAKAIYSHAEKRLGMTNQQTRRLTNHKDADGRTALHLAAMRCRPDEARPELVNLLMRKGADSAIEDRGAKLTACDLACKSGRRNSKELIECVDQENAAHRVNYRRRSSSREIEVPAPAASSPLSGDVATGGAPAAFA